MNKQKITANRFILTIGTVVLVLALMSCGNSDDDPLLPPGSEIVISPEDTNILITSSDSACPAGDTSDTYITVSVQDGDDRAIPGAAVTLSLAWSASTYTGPLPLMTLFVDLNRNGVPDANEDASLLSAGAYQTNTDDVTGDLLLIVRMSLTCAYSGGLTVQSSGYTAVAQFTVEVP